MRLVSQVFQGVGDPGRILTYLNRSTCNTQKCHKLCQELFIDLHRCGHAYMVQTINCLGTLVWRYEVQCSLEICLSGVHNEIHNSQVCQVILFSDHTTKGILGAQRAQCPLVEA